MRLKSVHFIQMVFKRENIHIVAALPPGRTVDTWQDGCAFMTNSCPAIWMMRHKTGFMRPDGMFSPLNHPLFGGNMPAVVFILFSAVSHGVCRTSWLTCFEFWRLFRRNVSFLRTAIVAVNCLSAAHLLARTRLAILCWPLSSATRFPRLQQT